MSKNIRDYSKSYEGQPKRAKRSVRREDLNGEQKSMYDDLEAKAKAYSGKSENELMSELMRKVSEGKKDGSFDPAQLNELAQQFSPMLTPEQRQRLASLIKMINK